MKFYILNLKHKDQNLAYKNWGPLSQFLSDSFFSPKLVPKPEIFALKAKAKLSIKDVLPFVTTGFSRGLLLNHTVKTILNGFKLPPNCRFYAVSVAYKNEILNNYHWLSIPALEESFQPIDFTKTLFCADFNTNSSKFDSVKHFKNYDEAVKMNGHLHNQGEIWLNKQAWQYDIILLPRISVGEGDGFIISEKLRNTLVENNISGIDIIETPWIKA